MKDSNGAPRLYIFDMGGVVCGNVHCVPAMAASLSLTEDEFFAAAGATTDGDAAAGSPYETGDVRAIQNGSIGSGEFWSRFEARAARLFPDRGVRLPRGVDGLPLDLWGRFFKPIRDEKVFDIITELIAAGHRVVCGTNTLPVHYDMHRARGDYDCFPAVYASHLMGEVKPDAEFWRRILTEEGFDEGETFFVDDNEANVEAAASLGIAAHVFSGATRLRAELDELGVFAV